jgi:MoaA/NifB/PqqE/SkfB family radical SAM enzyme
LQEEALRIVFRSLLGYFDNFGYLFGRRHKVRSLYLEVTHKCNLACLSCYTRAGVEKADALTLDEQKLVVRQAREMGAQVVSISGSGEPLLYRNLFDLIDYIRGLGMAVVVFTNGTTIDKEVAESLISRGVITYFKLYSLDPAVFDRMTGRKNAYLWTAYEFQFDGASRTVTIPLGLKNLLDAADARRDRNCVRIETLITRMNCRVLGSVAALAKDLGLGFHLETPVMKGRAMEHVADIVPSRDEYAMLYGELVRILGEEYFQQHREHPCPVERNPVVWTNGDVGFCSSRGASVGNVRNAPLSELFRKAVRLKCRQDMAIARTAKVPRYFRTCPSRQLYEAANGIPCDY